MRDITLEDTFKFDFTTRAFATGIPTVLAGTPVLSVHEEGNDTFITSGVTIDVSVGTSPVIGLNEGAVVATAANGYESGKSYSVFISTGTVGGVSVIGEVVEKFTVGSIKTKIDTALTDINLDHLMKVAVDNADVVDDSALAKIVSDAITATWVDLSGSRTTVSLSGLAVAQASIQGTTFSSSTDSLEAIRNRGDTSWTTGAGSGLTAFANGTAQAGTASTITLASAETFATNELRGNKVKITAGTGRGQGRLIASNVGSTDVVTIAGTWVTNPDSSSIYEIVDGGLEPTTLGLTLDVTATGAAGIDWANVENASSTVSLSATTVNLVTTLTTLTGHTVQTGDSFARIGALGVSLTDLGGMSTGMKTEVNDQMVDVMVTDTHAELAAIPTFPVSKLNMMLWAYELARLKGTQTVTTKTLFKDDGSTTLATSTVSDDATTFTRAEWT